MLILSSKYRVVNLVSIKFAFETFNRDPLFVVRRVLYSDSYPECESDLMINADENGELDLVEVGNGEPLPLHHCRCLQREKVLRWKRGMIRAFFER